ncbi:immunoglobulin-like domain-containing protein [Listeria booriae]|uniref:immunoglobulin-like domain-containing protein n=1 Tax=Listeria booriae TaxID=1552123 RepID=UPI001626A5D0|nr:immunoglobulin-like domain-containing protein [Listeria booriae]MBC1502286.1 DUF5011 domain-containing protein [Listeria booriae]
MLIKKIGAVSTALVVLASASVPSYATEQVNTASYATKAETKLKNSALKSEAKLPIEVISLQNGSFEQPAVPYGTWQTFNQSQVPGWQTTASDGLIEIQNHFEDRDAADGEQYAELNAYEASALYQDIVTTPGATVRWQVSHRGRHTTDTATVKFGTPGDLKLIDTMTTSVDAWKTYSGTYTIPAGQTTTRFQFEAVGGDPRNGNLLDNIVFATQSFITVSGNIDKTSVKKDKTATYSFDAKNEGGMASQKTTLSIPIPQEVTLNSPNVMVDGASVAGSYDSNTRILSIPLGSITKDATKHVTFDVKGTVVANNVTTQATVTHQDLGFADEDYTNYSGDVTLSVLANNAPTITATDHVLKKGSSFNPMAGVTASDAEDGNLTSSISVTANDVDTSVEGTYHVTYSVTDSDGNTTTKTITVTVSSNNAPVITAADKTLKKGASFDPVAGVSASDTEDGDVTDNVSVTANDVDTSAVGTYHVTYSVTDSDGNTTTKTITVTVTSNDAPVITASDKTLKKGGSFDPMAGVSASDTEDGNVTDKVSVTANDVDTSAVGTYHVTYSVTDSDGNTTTKTITVTVTSNDAPVIVASDQTLKKGKAFDVMAGVSASDLEDGDVTGGITVTANDVDTNTVGTYHVTYSVTDSDGNTTTKTITVTITSNDAPTFTTSDVYLKVGDKFNPYAGITASDTEDGDLTYRIDIESSDVDMTQAGTYAVEYSVTDSDNNTTKITRHVYVRTNDKPVIHASDQTFKAGASFDPLAGMSASDTEDGDITANVTVTANDVDANQAGTYHVTYSVTDSDDNTTTKTVTITVLTNEKPVIIAADITQKAHRSVDPMAGVTASDLEDGDLTANIKIIANDINTDVTYSVLDSDGNETEKTITVTILSNEAPVIHGQDVTFKAGKAFDPLAGVTASDTEDGDITSTIEITANDVNPDVAGVYHVTYSVTDSDGNTTEATYTVTVLTNEKPVIHATDQTLAYGQAFDPMAGVTAEDFEDGDLTGSIKVISNDVNPLQAGIYHVTYSVTDADGNETQITITVLVGAQPVDPAIPADPETPMHVTPAPVQMANPIVSSVSAPDPVRELPKTGDTDNTAQVITIGGLLAMLGALFLRRKK